MKSQTREYEIEYDDKKYLVEVNYEIVVDYNYGSDADGNRGRTAFFLEDYAAKIQDAGDLDQESQKEVVELAFEALESDFEKGDLDGF